MKEETGKIGNQRRVKVDSHRLERYRKINLPMETAFITAQTGMSYDEGEIYYYTLDHIGRPFNLRDDEKDLRWYEHHYAFGELIDDEVPNGAMTAGAGAYTTNWKPSFRFPGQYQDDDQYPFVQNHFREYMPEYGAYSSLDAYPDGNYDYNYAKNNPFSHTDLLGLVACKIIGEENGNWSPWKDTWKGPIPKSPDFIYIDNNWMANGICKWCRSWEKERQRINIVKMKCCKKCEQDCTVIDFSDPEKEVIKKPNCIPTSACCAFMGTPGAEFFCSCNNPWNGITYAWLQKGTPEAAGD